MRPHLLSMTAFGPYAESVEVDFDALAPHGLFLLHGPTGAGKTSLLDAMCFALYGTVPGTRNPRRLRSDHAAREVLCSVTLEATVAGRRIRLTRRPEQERPKKRGEGTTKEQTYVLLEEHSGAGWRTVSQRVDEVGEEISQRMGMSAEQFAQVVLLPQGRFAEFLHASSDDRAKLLEQLFSTHRFRAAEDWLASRRRETAHELEQQERVIADLVARFSEAAGTEPPEGAVMIGAAEGNVIEWAEGLLTAARDDVTHAATHVEAAHLLAEEARKHREAADAAFQASETHRAARERIAILEQVGADLESMQVEHAAAMRAEPLRTSVHASLNFQARAEKALQCWTSACTAAQVAADSSVEDLRQKWRDSVQRLAILESLGPVADQLRAARAESEECRATIEAVDLRLDDTRRQQFDSELRLVNLAQELQDQLRSAQSDLERSRSREQDLRAARLAGMGAELAGGLLPGEPCPVCGSAQHPAPARPVGVLVRVEDEEAAAVAVRVAEGSLAETQVALQLAESQLTTRNVHLRSPADQAEESDQGRRMRRSQESAQSLGALLVELSNRISSDTVALTAAHEKLSVAQARVEEMAGRLASAIGDHPDLATATFHEHNQAAALEAAIQARVDFDTAAGAADNSRAELARLMQDTGFDDVSSLTEALRDEEWHDRTSRLLSTHDRELDIAQRQLEELGETPLGIDLTAAALAQATAVDNLHQRQAELTLASRSAQRLEELLPGLRETWERAQPLRQERRLAKELADLANGEGSNVLRMRLSTYVLAARLEEVAAAASVRLAKMTGGRFTLEHTDERSGRTRAGLGLVVNDAYTGRARDPASLSGGETFMASLALALGLAEAVGHEAGANPIEALFVDEGFGTLDQDTLEQVMDILDSLREGGRMVGVVSHVPELRQRIRAQIQISRGLAGSTLEVLSA